MGVTPAPKKFPHFPWFTETERTSKHQNCPGASQSKQPLNSILYQVLHMHCQGARCNMGLCEAWIWYACTCIVPSRLPLSSSPQHPNDCRCSGTGMLQQYKHSSVLTQSDTDQSFMRNPLCADTATYAETATNHADYFATIETWVEPMHDACSTTHSGSNVHVCCADPLALATLSAAAAAHHITAVVRAVVQHLMTCEVQDLVMMRHVSAHDAANVIPTQAHKQPAVAC